MSNTIIQLIFAFLFIEPAMAQSIMTMGENRLVLNADSMTRRPGEIYLKGNVQVGYQENLLNCDEATIYTEKKQVVARGHLLLKSPTSSISGDVITLDYQNNTGLIKNAIIKQGQVLFEGENVKKTGENTYEIDSADYTACTTCPPAWKFSGTKIKATMGGYAYIRNSIMRIGGVPIFWFPYLIVPLNNKRQTGLLFPDFELSRSGGFTVSESVFWAISENKDMTITAKNYEFRGLKGLVNYRYMLNPNSVGELNVSGIQDSVFPKELEKELEGTGQTIQEGHLNRWHIKYSHSYLLPDDYQQMIDLNLVSDLRYPKDFPDEVYKDYTFSQYSASSLTERDIQEMAPPALENRMAISRNTFSSYMAADVAMYTNLLKDDPRDSNADSVHRFPELTYSSLPRRLGFLLFDLDASYVNFTREDKATDLNSETGQVIYRVGQRFQFTPQFSAPFRIGEVLDIAPSLSFHESDYFFPSQTDDPNEDFDKTSANRRYLRSDVSIRMPFSRIYGDLVDDQANRYRHEIIPEISFTSIPWRESTEHRFFNNENGKDDIFYDYNTSISDKDHLQFDFRDRLYNKNIISYGLTNTLTRRAWKNNEPYYKQIALLKVGQSFDYYEYQRETDTPVRPWSDINAILDVRLDSFDTNTQVRYFPYLKEMTTSSRVKIREEHGHYLEVEYSRDFVYTRDNNNDQDIVSSKTEDISSTIGFSFPHIVVSAYQSYSLIANEFTRYGYRLMLAPPGNCWNIGIEQERHGEELITKLGAAFLFDGQKKTATAF